MEERTSAAPLDEASGSDGVRDHDTDAILSRRDFLIRAALASAGVSLAVGAACDDTTPSADVTSGQDAQNDGQLDDLDDSTQAQPCLSVIHDTSETDAPQVCLADVGDTAPQDAPQPCLGAMVDVVDGDG